MILCPGCGQKLPDQFVRCQFCGADVSKVPRPIVQQKVSRPVMPVANWVWIAYYGIAGWWLIGGAKSVILGLMAMNDSKNEFGAFGIVGVIVGGITCIIALGIILRLEAVRAVVNFWNFLVIAFGLLALWGHVTATLVFGPIAILWVSLDVIDIASAVLMIFLIGETDKSARF